MSVNSKMKKICDNIRLRTGGTALLNLDEIAEAIMQIGEPTDLATEVYRTIGTTFPPNQLPCEAKFSGYDIDILTSTADDLYAYIDAKVSGKNTVTKETVGKDASNTYDIARYTFANREYCAWVKENYPKMYAWKNGSTIKYTKSVSPRINDNAFDSPYVSVTTTSGGTVANFTNLKDQCIYQYGKRYSMSGGQFRPISGSSLGSGVIVPVPSAAGNVVIRFKGTTQNTNFPEWYGGATASSFDKQYTPKEADSFGFITADSNGVYTATLAKDANISYIIFNTGDGEASAADFADFIITVNQPITYTTTSGSTVENGTPITAMSATNHTRIIGGAVYTRYEVGDVEPTLIHTGITDSRNSNASITESGVTYYRYPLGDLGANRKKLIPILLWANEHGDMAKTDKTLYHETKMCSVVVGRFLRDLATGEQMNNALYKFIRENCMLIVIPVVNPFGYNIRLTGGTSNNSDNGYLNANRVNINRNFDTPGWDKMGETNMGAYAGSENETQYVMNTLTESKSVVAMSIHGVGGWVGYCAHQGQNPDGTHYDKNVMKKISDFLYANYGYRMIFYDRRDTDGVFDFEPANGTSKNLPSVASKSPSFITQCGAYGGIVELQADDVKTSGDWIPELKSSVVENAYAQVLNLLAKWIYDYLENNH